jgi:hypothetical protein
MGMGSDGEVAVHCLALGALHRRADVLPPASMGQVRRLVLEAAVECWPAVLVPQGECQELLHEKADAGLCRVLQELALCCGNSSKAVRAHLLVLWQPQSASPAM